jgi:hypothetical protein
MYESLSTQRPKFARVGAASAALALLAAGCGGPGKYGKYPDIPRCFEKPQAPLFSNQHEPKPPRMRPGEDPIKFNDKWQRYNKIWWRWNNHSIGKLTKLTIPVRGGFAQGDPIYLPEIEDETEKALVQLDTGDWKGSGFLIEDSSGHEDVVTAAHVVGYARLGALTITGDNGVSTRAVAGCYMFEEDGKFKKMPGKSDEDSPPVDIDLAILRLSRPLGHHTLMLSEKSVTRGQWLDFTNYQGLEHGPGYPANYTGVVVSTEHDFWGYRVLTGTSKMDTPVTAGEVQDNEIYAGASGGPVTELHGKVVGISVAGLKDGIYEGPEDLKGIYNVRMPGAKWGLKHGYIPATANLVSSRFIKKAMHSKRFWSRSQLAKSK